MMPANTTITVTVLPLALAPASRTIEVSQPLFSARPQPSIIVSTAPSGANPRKLLGKLINIFWRFAIVSRLTAVIVSPVPGWTTLAPAVKYEIINRRTQRNANSTTGSGSLFPAFSIFARILIYIGSLSFSLFIPAFSFMMFPSSLK